MRNAVLALLCTLVCAASVAQTTASLTGTVTSQDGAAVAGATVTVSSPVLQGTRTTRTGENGAYHFDALPPGSYTVSATNGELRSPDRRVRLQLDLTSYIDLTLLPGSADVITVTAERPAALDVPEVATNLPLELIDDLPVQRNQLATAQLAVGVVGNVLANGQLQISGAPGYDNLVLVNGVVVTENVRSQMRPMYVEDAIEETTILSGAISAEYGRFTGGVVNTITRSGGNAVSASLRDSLSNPRWASATPAGEERPDTLNHVWEATLGGPLLRDRLWFFAAGRWAKNDTARITVAPPGGPATSYSESNDQKRYEAKLTGRIGERQNVVASYFAIDTQQENTRFNANFYDLDSLSGRDDPESLVALRYDALVSGELLVEGQYSRRRFSLNTGATSTDPLEATPLLDRAGGNARFYAPSGCAICGSERRDNDDLMLKANWFGTVWRGTHQIVAGIDRFDEERVPNNRASGSDFLLFVTRTQFRDGVIYPVVTPTTAQGGGTFIRWSPLAAPPAADRLRTDSIFLNDRWDITDRWSVSLGARWDRNDAVDANGTTTSDDSRLSPRLAVMYDVRGDGRHRVSASYGEYTSRIAEGIASSNQTAGNTAMIDFAYKGPAINGNQLTVAPADVLRQVLEYFNTRQGGTANTAADNLRTGGVRSVPGFATYFDGTLRSPSVREVTVGYGMQLGAHGFVRADAIARDWRDFYAASVTTSTRRATTPFGIPVDLALYRNSNDIERTYRGLQLQARWSPRNIEAGLHYTWSKLRGNDEGESGTTGAVANSDPSIFYPEFLDYERFAPVGYLPGDQRHRLRAWASYTIGAFTASLLQTFDSAAAYSMAGPVNVTRYAGAPANLGYNAIPNGIYYFSDRGALRVDDIHATNVALRYNLPLAGTELFAQADVLNVFDNDGIADPLRINTTVATAATTATLTPFDPFRETPELGRHYQPAAAFGQPLNDLAYQTPRTVRISVGVRF